MKFNEYKKYGLYLKQGLPSWTRRISPVFYERIKNSILNNETILVIDLGNVDKISDVAGLGFIPKDKEIIKKCLIYDMNFENSVLGIMESIEHKDGFDFLELFYKFFLKNNFSEINWNELKDFLTSIQTKGEEITVLTILSLLNEDFFWEEVIKSIPNYSEDKKAEVEKYKFIIKEHYQTNDVWKEMFTLSNLQSYSIQPFWKNEYKLDHNSFFLIANQTKVGIQQIHLTIELFLFSILKFNDELKIYTIFDDDDYVENALVWDFVKNRNISLYSQKSYYSKEEEVNYNFGEQPNEKLSEIVWLYSAKKWGRKKKFVDAEISARLNLEIADEFLPPKKENNEDSNEKTETK